MDSVWIVLIVVSIVIFQKLFASFGKQAPTEKFRGVVPGTGQVFEMTLSRIKEEGKKDANTFNDDDFCIAAKIGFNSVVEAFSKGDKAMLKRLLSKKLYDVFCAEIDKREQQNQKMDFSLIGFDSTKILLKNDTKKPTLIKVEFITEQMNVLRDKDDVVIEGDAVQLSKVRDVWTFKKENGINSKWTICATKSEGVA